MTEQTEAPETKELTKEEYEQRKLEMLTYYNEQIPFLTKQLEYEMLITQLEEALMRRLRAQEIIANIKAPAPPQSENNTKERKLVKSS